MVFNRRRDLGLAQENMSTSRLCFRSIMLALALGVGVLGAIGAAVFYAVHGDLF